MASAISLGTRSGNSGRGGIEDGADFCVGWGGGGVGAPSATSDLASDSDT